MSEISNLKFSVVMDCPITVKINVTTDLNDTMNSLLCLFYY